jgi:hypothetical protein
MKAGAKQWCLAYLSLVVDHNRALTIRLSLLPFTWRMILIPAKQPKTAQKPSACAPLILWLNQQLRSLLRKHQSKNPAFFLQELLLPREREEEEERAEYTP